jgi:CubicO group peptidase (beta-lactamase class C family)
LLVATKEVDNVALDIAKVEGELQHLLDKLCPQLNIPGAAAGVWYDGREAVSCHGVTSVADPLPIEPGTLFMIGSTSKTFTATALMTQVESGHLHLDDRVVDHMPDLVLADPDAREVLTVGHLLDHTAGSVGDSDTETGFGDDALARAIPIVVSEAQQLTSPGTIVSYNNSAFTLAGRLLETVTGHTYESVVRDLVLAPLELNETWLAPWEVAQRRLAVGHALRGGEPVPQLRWPEQRWCVSAGGVISTVRDQLRYACFHLCGGRPLTDQTRIDMQRQRVAARSGVRGVGVSWLLQDYGEMRLVEHGGNIDNVQVSSFTLVPDENIAVTTLANAAGGGALGARIFEHVMTSAGLPKPAPLRPRPPNPRTTRELTGRYDAGQWWLEVTTDEEGQLFIQRRLHDTSPTISQEIRASFEGPPQQLVLVEDDVVATADAPTHFAGDFIRDESGAICFLRYGPRLSKKASG